MPRARPIVGGIGRPAPLPQTGPASGTFRITQAALGGGIGDAVRMSQDIVAIIGLNGLTHCIAWYSVRQYGSDDGVTRVLTTA